jgi:HAD superfamily hydrolase (TIGR01509 family)
MGMRVRAVVFDFDGVVLDTETTDFRAWCEIFDAHGCELRIDEWVDDIGTQAGFDVYGTLRSRARGAVPPEDELRARKRARVAELLEGVQPLPGVTAWLDEAESMGIPVGIASSSPPGWIEHHLHRLGLRHRFACVACCDGSLPPKPDPASYLAACDRLGARPADAVAVEDSPHGVAAARRAGLYTVAVPHDLTRALDLSGADVVVESLADLPLSALVTP